MSLLRGQIEIRPRSVRVRSVTDRLQDATWRDQGAHGRAGCTRRTRGRRVQPFLSAAAIAFTMAGMDNLPPDRDLAAIALLHDPVRRALYGHVVAAGGEVSRNQAAEAVGGQRGLAAFHLDKLVEAGLLEAAFRRLGDRRGPGAGRPAKLYRRAARGGGRPPPPPPAPPPPP